MNTTIDKIQNNTARYWLVDGLGEITIGALFILLGLFFWSSTLLPPQSPLAGIHALGLPVLFFGFARISRRVVNSLKARYTYPRTGYVAFRRPATRRRWVMVAFASVISLSLIVLGFAMEIDLQSWMPLLDGVLLGLILLYIGQGLFRYYVLSAAAFLAGILLSENRVGGNLGHAGFYGVLGLLLFVSGVLTLYSYLRQHQPVEGEKM
jgi:hypothetical protein